MDGDSNKAAAEERDFLLLIAQLTDKMDAQTVGRLIVSYKALGGTYAWLENAMALIELYSPLGPQQDTVKTQGNVADDVTALRREVKWEVAKTHYAEQLRHIRQATRDCIAGLGEASEERRKRFEARLPAAKAQVKTAVESVLDGLTLGGAFHVSLLDGLYEKTGAHKHDIGNSLAEVMVIVVGGLMTVACYDVIVRGQDAAAEASEETGDTFKPALQLVVDSVEKILARCEESDNVGPAIEKDMRRFLEEKVSNEDTAHKMLHYFWEKYDYMEFFVIVHEKTESDNSMFDSDANRVEASAKGRRAIIYFRKRDTDYELIYNKEMRHKLGVIMSPLSNKNNKRLFTGLQGAMNQLGVADDYWALAVIRADEDVQVKTNFRGTYYWSRANKYITFAALSV